LDPTEYAFEMEIEPASDDFVLWVIQTPLGDVSMAFIFPRPPITDHHLGTAQKYAFP
jgi:hypothetical protein